ncbi:MAG: hypothetical protein KF832_08680 [Caldilineaceae bacterium]|nr:hypothetical protein [Caldilineaceae bacterium]
MVTRKEKSRSSVFGPIVLIGLGVVLLLSNFGILEWNLWELAARFWPLFLVAAGLDLLLGRRTNSGAVVAIMLIIGLLLGGFWLGYFQSSPATGGAGQPVQQALEGATQATIDIESSVSQMQIQSGATATMLVEGNVALHNNERLDSNFRTDSGMAYYTLRSASPSVILPSFGNREDGLWDLRLNAQTPTALTVETGVGSATLNLEQLNLTALAVSAGIGKVEITLPAQGNFAGAIEGGIGEIVVIVPDTLAVTLIAKAGVGNVEIDSNYYKNGDEYRSSNFDSAANQATLTIDGGVGRIVVRQVSKR